MIHIGWGPTPVPAATRERGKSAGGAESLFSFFNVPCFVWLRCSWFLVYLSLSRASK